MAKDKNGQPLLPGLQNIQDQSSAFNRLKQEYIGKGQVTKKLPSDALRGNFQRTQDGRWIKADSSEVISPQDNRAFDSTMEAHGIRGKQQLYDKFRQPPTPKLQDSVFAFLKDRQINDMPQTKLNGRVVCTAGKGCVVEKPFDVDGKTVAKHGHEGKMLTQMNEAGYLAQTGNTGDRKGLQNSWDAGSEVTPELERMTAAGDTAKVGQILRGMKGFQQGNTPLFKTEMRKDTIPEQVRTYTQQDMNELRSEGNDKAMAAQGFRQLGYKDINEMQEKFNPAGNNPVREEALKLLKQRMSKKAGKP